MWLLATHSSETEKSKCQDLPKFEFSGERGRGGILKLKSQSGKICPNFNFRGGGGGGGVGGILKLKSQSAKISDNFHFQGGGEEGILKLYFRIGVFCRIWTKISTTPAGSCITDSLSHTTYVETNKKEKVKLIDCNILLSCAHSTSTKMLHNFMIISMLQLLCFTNKNADFMRVKINYSSRGGY